MKLATLDACDDGFSVLPDTINMSSLGKVFKKH